LAAAAQATTTPQPKAFLVQIRFFQRLLPQGAAAALQQVRRGQRELLAVLVEGAALLRVLPAALGILLAQFHRRVITAAAEPITTIHLAAVAVAGLLLSEPMQRFR
jgi:hypothetical protein